MLHPVIHNRKFGYVDNAGNLIAPLVYEQAGQFSDGLGYLKKDGDLFIVDLNCKTLATVRSVTAVGRYSGGYLRIEKDDKYGLIDEHGNQVIRPSFDSLYPCTNGLCIASSNGFWGLVTVDGRWVSEHRFRGISALTKGEGITGALISDDSSIIINMKGERVSDVSFAMAYCFNVGVIPVRLHGRDAGGCTLASSTGKLLSNKVFEEIGSVASADGVSVQLNGLWGIVDLRLNWVLEPKYTVIENESEQRRRFLAGGQRGYTGVTGGHYGFLDAKGQIVIAPEYEDATDFINGAASVYTLHNGIRRRRLIDITGRVIWQEPA